MPIAAKRQGGTTLPCLAHVKALVYKTPRSVKGTDAG
jgi:hypothetical protein